MTPPLLKHLEELEAVASEKEYCTYCSNRIDAKEYILELERKNDHLATETLKKVVKLTEEFVEEKKQLTERIAELTEALKKIKERNDHMGKSGLKHQGIDTTIAKALNKKGDE